MIKFFRHIRERLIMENKTFKYFKYAIGEIILVVIGILIALQVNNWNEEQREIKQGELIKKNIHQEFIKNQKLLQESKRLNEEALNANQLLINLVGAERPELAKYNLDSLINSSLMAETYLPTSNALQDITQSGRMNLLQDDELKNTILDWNAALDLFREYNHLQSNWYNNQYFPYIMPTVSFRQMDIYNKKPWAGKSKLTTDYYSIFHDIKFENLMENNLYLIDYMLTKLRDIEKYQKKIIELTKQK
ncbi:DUF6090 family protein [Aegicerativicinus sediminis]|uniref:DUF6090 family protein n=1 Tax=Aegicerativicinus sediminis TaxID=2893202 RepID=UPI001E5A1F40|nr:DUF6090 family protein [Aegicerativicinus sediminis]